MYTSETLDQVLDGFEAQIGVAVKQGKPNAGSEVFYNSKGERAEQSYANGDTVEGRLSATILKRYREDQVVLRLFRLANNRMFNGEDTPDDEEIDTAFSYVVSVNHIDEVAGADYFRYDNVAFENHLAELADISPDDDEARRAHFLADDDSDVWRPIEPGEMEYVVYLLGQVTISVS